LFAVGNVLAKETRKECDVQFLARGVSVLGYLTSMIGYCKSYNFESPQIIWIKLSFTGRFLLRS
jgi:hypothetical protein